MATQSLPPHSAQVTDHNHQGEVEVGHTDYTYAVDDTGTVVLTWTAAMTVDDIVNDLEILLG